jgi:hypothetical protein
MWICNNDDDDDKSKCVYEVLYGTERKISHLLYMDDLKLAGTSEENQEMKSEL